MHDDHQVSSPTSKLGNSLRPIGASFAFGSFTDDQKYSTFVGPRFIPPSESRGRVKHDRADPARYV